MDGLSPPRGRAQLVQQCVRFLLPNIPLNYKESRLLTQFPSHELEFDLAERVSNKA